MIVQITGIVALEVDMYSRMGRQWATYNRRLRNGNHPKAKRGKWAKQP